MGFHFHGTFMSLLWVVLLGLFLQSVIHGESKAVVLKLCKYLSLTSTTGMTNNPVQQHWPNMSS